MKSHITLRSYILGFIISLALTISAYFTAVSPTLTPKFALTFVIILAFIQLIAQLVFFLHMGKEPKPHVNLYFFLSTIIGIGILVGGSLWIMYNLNYNHMSPMELNDYFQEEEGIYR